jgi:hypothetical protein
MIRALLFLLIITAAAQAQKAPEQVVIEKREFFTYTDSIGSRCSDFDELVLDSVKVFTDIFEYEYPFIKSSDKGFQDFVNDTIHKILGLSEISQVQIKWEYLCQEDKPAENYYDFSVNICSEKVLSLTLQGRSYASGLAGGYETINIPLSLRLKEKRFLTGEQVFKKRKLKAASEIFIHQLNSLPGNPSENTEVKVDYKKIKFYPAELHADKIVLYEKHSMGEKTTYVAIEFPFSIYRNLFRRGVINILKEK